MSRLLDDYGLDVWIWYPAMDRDYADPKTVRARLKEWGEVFRKLPRIDAVFVPGGDPGHTPPKRPVAAPGEADRVLRRYHPKAEMWVSPQGFDAGVAWTSSSRSSGEQPAWLGGVVYGPQVRVSLPELREAVPEQYPIRRYPDITHSLKCQFPVPDWDLAFALTEGREAINPRPRGAGARSSGRSYRRHDRLHHLLRRLQRRREQVRLERAWAGTRTRTSIDILRSTAATSSATAFADGFAQGLLALERNWRGPAADERDDRDDAAAVPGHGATATPQDGSTGASSRRSTAPTTTPTSEPAAVRDRARGAAHGEAAASAGGSARSAAMEQREAILDRAVTQPVAADRRARVFELAEALFQSIRMQLSVERYQAIAVERGANLDTIDVPLNNRPWLKRSSPRSAAGQRSDRLRGIERPGQLDRSRSRRVLRRPGRPDGSRTWSAARGSSRTRYSAWPLTGFATRPTGRWPGAAYAESLYDTPLRMHYADLDPRRRTGCASSTPGDQFATRIRLVAEGVEIHPLSRSRHRSGRSSSTSPRRPRGR